MSVNQSPIKYMVIGVIAATVILSLRTRAASIKILKPVLDDQTFAVIHVDLTRIDPNALMTYALGVLSQRLEPAVLEPIKTDLEAMQVKFNRRYGGFIFVGVKEVYLVFSMYDFPGFFKAVPIPAGSDRQALYTHFQRITRRQAEMGPDNNLILLGDKRILERIKTGSSPAPAYLDAAFTACTDTKALQVVYAPSSDQRRVVSEMLPPLPAPFEAVQLGQLISPLQWMVLEVNGPPGVSIDLTLKAQGRNEADQLLGSIKQVYASVNQSDKVREFVPNVQDLLNRLTPNQQDSRLQLAMNHAAADTLIQDLVTPTFLNVHGLFARFACGSNLSDMGKAILLYSNDHNDECPPDIASLIEMELPAKSMICPATRAKDSYIYRGAGLTTSALPTMIMVYDRLNNHGGEGRNVLYLDSHVEWVTEARFQEMIQKDNDYRRAKNLPVLPAQ